MDVDGNPINNSSMQFNVSSVNSPSSQNLKSINKKDEDKRLQRIKNHIENRQNQTIRGLNLGK